MANSMPGVMYHSLACVTVALIAVLLVRPFLRHIVGLKISYAIWGLVPLVMLGAVVPAPPPSPSGTPLQVVHLQVPMFASERVVTPGLETFSASRWIIVLWLVGVGVFALIQWHQQRAFVRRLGVLRRNETGEWVAEGNDVGPVVVGLFPPKIVLPSDFQQRYIVHEQALVLAHERMHLQRRDPWANYVVAIMRSLLWFHPLVHLATRMFRIDQELACDAAVLEARPQDRSRYAQAILKTQLGGDAFVVGCRLAPLTASSLKRRIIMLRIPAPNLWRRLLGATIVSIACLASSGFAWASKSQVQSSVSASKVVREGEFVINLQADIRSVSKKHAVKASLFDTVKAGKVAEFRLTSGENTTYVIMVTAEADTFNNKLIDLQLGMGTIAANGDMIVKRQPFVATVENHHVHYQSGDPLPPGVGYFAIDLVVTRK